MNKIKLILIFTLLVTKILFAQEERRYISLAPATTEILFALGLDKEIVGVSSYCNYPQGALNKEKVGDFSRPNIEKIVSLRPDFIFCTGLEQAPVISELKRLKLNVYVSDPKDMNELFVSILRVGEITGKTKEAQSLVSMMHLELDKLQEKIKSAGKKPAVFIEIWNDPLTTAGRGSFLDSLISLAGGINIAADTKRPYSIFSAEEVINRNPDCIIFTYMGKDVPKESIKLRPGWNKISAFRNNRLYADINPDILLRPGPRSAEAVKEIYKRIHEINE